MTNSSALVILGLLLAVPSAVLALLQIYDWFH